MRKSMARCFPEGLYFNPRMIQSGACVGPEGILAVIMVEIPLSFIH